MVRYLFASVLALATTAADDCATPITLDPTDAASAPVVVDPGYVDPECSVPHAPGSTYPPCCEACTRLGQLGCQHWGNSCGMMCLSAAPPPGVWAAEIAAAGTTAEAEWVLTRYYTGYVCRPEDP